tara:strand:- start:53075 stop:54589 length:1515 start_codon:yes stop_codon:yes gene_type:complete
MGKYVEQCRRREEQHRRLQQRIEEDCRQSGHGRPLTRRDFLGRGFISGMGMVFAPTLSTFLARQAHAECDLTSLVQGAGKIPFISIDQGGGANIAGSNVMVGSLGQENFLSPEGYAKLGLPEAIIPDNVGVDRTFGIAMHPNSAMLRGMLDKTSVAARAGTNGIVIPARSDNDTGNNPHNPVYGIAQAGANGQFVAAVGTRNSDTGGRSDAPDYMIDPSVRPTKVSNSSEAIGLGGGDDDNFPTGEVAEAAAIISQLKLGKINVEEATRELVQCGYDKSSATFNTAITATELDPNQDADLQAIFPNGELNDGDFRKAAAVMKTVIKGFAGAGTIEYGGRDYHQNPRPETDEKDFVVGQVIGATLEYAMRANQPVMIYVFSDGAVSADTNTPEDDGNGTTKFRWRSDSSATAASAIFVYQPGGARPALRGNALGTNQLGTFTMDGNVNTSSSPFANNVVSLAELVVLNYLGLHGQQARFGTDVLVNNGLGTGATVDPYIAFNPIA